MYVDDSDTVPAAAGAVRFWLICLAVPGALAEALLDGPSAFDPTLETLFFFGITLSYCDSVCVLTETPSSVMFPCSESLGLSPSTFCCPFRADEFEPGPFDFKTPHLRMANRNHGLSLNMRLSGFIAGPRVTTTAAIRSPLRRPHPAYSGKATLGSRTRHRPSSSRVPSPPLPTELQCWGSALRARDR